MKNLHYLKKFVVMVLAAMMTLSTFAMPTFAADPVNKASFTVSGLDQASSVTAYKVVNVSTGSDRGATSLVVADSIADVENPTYDQIMALVYEARKDNSKLSPISATSFTGGVATFADADPGMYIVTIQNKKDASVVYNPVVVSVNLKDGTGDAEAKTFAVGDTTSYELEGSNGTLKKSTIPFEKVVDRDAAKNGSKNANVHNGQTTGDQASVDADGLGVDDGNRGDTAGKGDTVWFRINTMVPDYADNFFKSLNNKIDRDPEFEIYDTMSAGLDLNANSISLHYYDATAKEWKPFESGWTKDFTTGERTFKVEFTPAGVLALKGKKVEVRYSAEVNGNHGYNYKAETNTGGFNYTRNPGEKCDKGEEKTTYHYTFTVNGGLKGPDTPENREIIKIGTDASGKFVLEETTAMGETSWRPLEGATFDLYKKVNGEWVKDTTRSVYSDDEGILRGIDRVDAGEYKLKETKAPEGFAKNETDIEFKIEATLDTEGRMINYKVSVHGTDNWITVGDYNVSYATGSGNTATSIANVTYPGAAAGHTTTAYKVQLRAEAGEEYMDKDGNTKVAEGGELKFQKEGTGENEKIVPVTKTVTQDDFDQAANIRNSKVGTLPSTGGMGTVLFTIGGVAIMALALFLLFGGKKKQHQK